MKVHQENDSRKYSKQNHPGAFGDFKGPFRKCKDKGCISNSELDYNDIIAWTKSGSFDPKNGYEVGSIPGFFTKDDEEYMVVVVDIDEADENNLCNKKGVQIKNLIGTAEQLYDANLLGNHAIKTPHGMHCLFRLKSSEFAKSEIRNTSGRKCALQCFCDYRIGTVGYHIWPTAFSIDKRYWLNPTLKKAQEDTYGWPSVADIVNDLEDLPLYFYNKHELYNSNKAGKWKDIISLEEGQRSTEMIAYGGLLAGTEFTIDEIMFILESIGRHCFTYGGSNPFNEKDIKRMKAQILKYKNKSDEENRTNPKTKRGKDWYKTNKETGVKRLILNSLADYLRQKWNPIKIQGYEGFHMYTNGYYRHYDEESVKSWIKKYLWEEDIKPNNLDSVYKLIKTDLKTWEGTIFSRAENYINFQNGLFNVVTGKLEPHSPKVLTFNRIPWNCPITDIQDLWNEIDSTNLPPDHYFYSVSSTDSVASDLEPVNKYCERARKYVAGFERARYYFSTSFIDGFDQLPLVASMMGAFFLSNMKYQRFFILMSPKGKNGKGTFEKLVYTLFNYNPKDTEDTEEYVNNISSVDIEDMTGQFGDKVKLFSIAKKLINIAGELPPKGFQNDALIKMLTGENHIMLRTLYQKPMTILNYASMLFSCNKIPVNFNATEAYYRRVTIIPFRKTPFSDTEKIQDLDRKLVDEADGGVDWWIKLSLLGACALVDEKTCNYEISRLFAKCNIEELGQYRISSDKQLEFIGEFCEERERHYVKPQDLYKIYTKWVKAVNKGGKVISRKQLLEQFELFSPEWKSKNRSYYKDAKVKSSFNAIHNLYIKNSLFEDILEDDVSWEPLEVQSGDPDKRLYLLNGKDIFD